MVQCRTAGLRYASQPTVHAALAAAVSSVPRRTPLQGLAAANVAGLALVLAVIRKINDGSEPLTIVKIQVSWGWRQGAWTY